MTIPILENSAGWNWIGPNWTARYAPLTGLPTRGASRTMMLANAIRYR